MRALTAVAIAVCAVAIAAAGCGGGDDSTAESLSKAQYLKQADAICAKTEGRQLALMQSIGEAPSPENSEKLIRVAGLPPLQTQAEELSELVPPAELEKQVDLYLVAFETGVEETEADPLKLTDIKKNPFKKSKALAEDMGLVVCGGA